MLRAKLPRYNIVKGLNKLLGKDEGDYIQMLLCIIVYPFIDLGTKACIPLKKSILVYGSEWMKILSKVIYIFEGLDVFLTSGRSFSSDGSNYVPSSIVQSKK